MIFPVNADFRRSSFGARKSASSLLGLLMSSPAARSLVVSPACIAQERLVSPRDAAPAHAPPLLHLPVLRAWMAGEAAPDAAPNIDESVLAQAMLLMRE